MSRIEWGMALRPTPQVLALHQEDVSSAKADAHRQDAAGGGTCYVSEQHHDLGTMAVGEIEQSSEIAG